MKSIAIIVLNWRTADLSVNTVFSLKKISHSKFNYKILLVDNGSGDNSVPLFNKNFKHDPSVTIVETGSNLGYVDGNNYGIKIALQKKYDYSLVINSDVEVKPDFLEKLFNFLEKNSGFAMVGPKIYFAKGFEFHKDRYSKRELGKVIWSVGGHIDWNNIYGSNRGIDEVDHGQYNEVDDQVDYLSGCCLLIKNDVFKKIGLFDSKYFMYSEDADFSRRLVKNNFKIAYIPDSIIWHINSGSSGRGPIHDYFLSRNRLLFGFRYARPKTKFALFRDSLKILFTSPFVWQRFGVRDYYLGKLGKGSWK